MKTLIAVIAITLSCISLPRTAFAGNGHDKDAYKGAFVSASSQHRPLHEIWHYINTHKELLAADAVVIAAWSADAGSTINDEHNCPSCVEQNPIVGPHPSAHVVWLYAFGMAGMQTAINNLAWHYAPDPILRHMVWIPAIIIGTNEAATVSNNVHYAEAKSPSALHLNPGAMHIANLSPTGRSYAIKNFGWTPGR